MLLSHAGTYYFGPYTVDLRTHSLARDGVRIAIQEQPFQILIALLESPGRVVTREDLRRRLWGEEIFVDFDQSMNSAVRRLRVALDDNPKAPVFVETVPRIGFRFVAPLQFASPQPVAVERELVSARSSFRLEHLPSLLRDAAPRVQLTLSTAAIFSIAMLLGLSFAARTRFVSAKVTDADDAHSVVDPANKAALRSFASVRSQFLSIPVPGVVPPRDTQTCRQEFGRSTCAPEAAVSTIKKAQPGLLQSVPASASQVEPPLPNAAELANLEGRYLLSLRDEHSYARASEAFQRALEADPHSTSAMVGLAQVNVLLSLEGINTEQHLGDATAFAARALQINPRLGAAHAAIAAVTVLKDWNWTAANANFQRAIALDPGDSLTHLWYAIFVLVPQKQYEAAEQQVHRAIELDPFSLIAQTKLGWVYFEEGRDQAALDQYRLVLRMNASFVPARFHMAQLLHKEGRNAEAARFEPSDPTLPAHPRLASLPGHAAGEQAPAADPCRQLTTAMSRHHGDPLPAIQAAIEHHCPAMLYMDKDPGFTRLQEDPRSADLAHSLHLSVK